MDEKKEQGSAINPSTIFQLATAYWGSSVLLTANRLKVLSAIGHGEKPSQELADKLGTAVHATEMLLNACASMGLLDKKDDKYKNTDPSSAFLVEGSPGYLGDALRYSDDLFPVWGRLEDTLRSGKPALKHETILGEDTEKTRNFVLGMHNRALGVGRSLAVKLDLRGRKRLLDVGGGPATYSILLTKQNIGLTSRVMDLPKVVEIAQEIIKDFHMEERVQAIVGDYTNDPFPDGNDCILCSGIFHRETTGLCKMLISKAFDALEHGGVLIINDVFCNREKDGPPFAMLFGINMLLTSNFGTIHSTFEVTQWFMEAGFINIAYEPLPPPMPHTIIQGVKP